MGGGRGVRSGRRGRSDPDLSGGRVRTWCGLNRDGEIPTTPQQSPHHRGCVGRAQPQQQQAEPSARPLARRARRPPAPAPGLDGVQLLVNGTQQPEGRSFASCWLCS
eukprot:gene12776-55508_t